jgi:hypothetical protein
MDIIARLRLNGEGFSSDFRGRFAEMESAASASARRMTGILKGVTSPPLSAASSASAFTTGQAAADRMLASVDHVFAAQLRYNQQIAKANELHATGMLSTANYARVQAGLKADLDQASLAQQRMAGSAGMARAGYQQLSFQIGDVTQQLALGVNPAVVFGQQMGQIAQALSLIEGGKASGAGDAVSSLKEDFDGAAGAIEQAQGATEQLTEVLGAGAAATEGNSAATGANAAAQRGRTGATAGSSVATGANSAATASNTAATEANAVATTGLAAAKSRLVGFLAGPWGAALIGAVTVLGLFGSKIFDTDTELEKLTADLDENARKTTLNREAQEAHSHTMVGVIDRIREQTEALQEQNRTLEENSTLRAEQAGDLLNEALASRDWLRGAAESFGGNRALNRAMVQAFADPIVARAEAGVNEAAIAGVRGEAEALGDAVAGINRQFDQEVRSAERAAVAIGQVTAATAREIAAINVRRQVAIEAERERQRIAEAENRDYSRVPFAEVRARIIANEAPLRVGGYNALAYNTSPTQNAAGVHAPGLLTSMTMGQLYDFQLNVMRPLTRGRRGPRDVGSTGAGAYMFESGTLRENAALTFGEDWRSQLFSVANQDRVAETLYNRVRGNRTQLRNTWAAFQPGHTGRDADDAAAAAAAAAQANALAREEQARARILAQAHASTVQAVEQARLGDMRARGLDSEAALEEQLNAKRAEAAERIAGLREAAAERGAGAQEQDAIVAAQQQITPGLQEQLDLLDRQSAIFNQLLFANRDREHLTTEQVQAEEEAAAALQQTRERAQGLAVTVADTLALQERQLRVQDRQNAVVGRAGELRQKQNQAARMALEEQEQELEQMKEDMRQREEGQYRELAALWGDLMRGNVDSIWDRFKEAGIDAIAEIAAQWTLAMMTGQKFDLGGTMAGMGQSGGFGPLGSLLGVFGKGSGGAGSGEGLWGSLGAGGGGEAGGGGAGGVAPYAVAAIAVFSILKGLGVFSSTKRGSATLGYSGGELSTAATRGNSSSYIAASSSAMDSVGSSLERIAEMLGGDVTGAGSVSLGQRDGKWRGDPSGQGITKTKKGAIDFGEDQEAAIRWAISEALRDGVISGISDAAKRLLQSGKDLEKAIAKALMIEEIPKLLKARLDPVGAALDALNEKWDKTVAALKEGGATAEQTAEAQQLYKLELEDTIAKTAAASASLKEFLDSLKMGSDSPYSLRQQEETARAALQPFLDKIAAGESIDQDQYQQTAQTYLDIERQLYGSTDQFFAAMDLIMAATNKAIERIDSAVPIRTAVDPFVEATAANTGTMTEQLEGLQSTLSQILGAVSGGAVPTAANDFIGGGAGFINMSAA